MKKICVLNYKGGVAKTISTINIGSSLQEKGYKVLLVDLDSQGNTSKLMNNKRIRKGNKYENIDCYSLDSMMLADILKGDEAIKDCIKNTAYEGLDVITNDFRINNIDEVLKKGDNRFLLKEVLSEVENDYDYAIFDLPPSLDNGVTLNGLIASDWVITPFKIDQMSIDGLGSILNKIDEINEELDLNIEFKACFVTMDNRTRVNRQVKEFLKEELGEKFCKTTISSSSKVVESTFEQKPVIFYSRKSAPGIQYRNLTEEIINMK